MRRSDAPRVMSAVADDGPVLFFDGTCVLCNGLADFVLRYDRRGRLRLATLQGQTAGVLLGGPDSGGAPGITAGVGPGSVVMWENGRIHRKSDAVIRVLQRLGGVFRLAGLLRLVPRAVRDAVYDLVARNRIRWFGRRPACRLPTAAESGRFLS